MPKDHLIYLASPYSHPDPAVMQRRYEQVCEATAALIRQGYLVYSPIVHSHPLVSYGLPTDWGYWQQLDEAMIRRCQQLWILTLDGWSTSRGIVSELRIVNLLGLPVYRYSLDECINGDICLREVSNDA